MRPISIYHDVIFSKNKTLFRAFTWDASVHVSINYELDG